MPLHEVNFCFEAVQIIPIPFQHGFKEKATIIPASTKKERPRKKPKYRGDSTPETSGNE
jgi:hypothetical protein